MFRQMAKIGEKKLAFFARNVNFGPNGVKTGQYLHRFPST